MLNSCITSENLGEIEAIADKAREWGVNLCYSAYSARRTGCRDYFLECRRAARRTERAAGPGGTRRDATNWIVNSPSTLEATRQYFANGGTPGCKAGLRFLVVTADGALQPCSMQFQRYALEERERMIAEFTRQQPVRRVLCLDPLLSGQELPATAVGERQRLPLGQERAVRAGRRGGIQKQDRGRMPPQRRRRAGFHDRPFKRGPHGGALMLAIDEHQRARHAQEERHGERKGARRHVLQPGERPVVHLLHAADIVEFHGPHIPRIVEIADRRIDERQVSVLADPHDHQAGRRLPATVRRSARIRPPVRRFAIQLMKCRNRNVVEQAVAQEAAEGCRMVAGHPRILVHVKCGERRPIDFVRAQCRQERILRHGGGEDHCRPPGPRDLGPYDPCRDLRARRPGGGLVREHPHFEPVPRKLLMICAHEITIAPVATVCKELEGLRRGRRRTWVPDPMHGNVR